MNLLISQRVLDVLVQSPILYTTFRLRFCSEIDLSARLHLNNRHFTSYICFELISFEVSNRNHMNMQAQLCQHKQLLLAKISKYWDLVVSNASTFVRY